MTFLIICIRIKLQNSGEPPPYKRGPKTAVSPYHEVGTQNSGECPPHKRQPKTVERRGNAPLFDSKEIIMLNMYYVTDDYMDYIRNFDDRIYYNKNATRPYVGIVMTIGDYDYYAPLSSPKQKHLKMHNSQDFRKINGGRYGAINFNYMLPVPATELVLLQIPTITDIPYRRLLQNQLTYIKMDESIIRQTVLNLYRLCEKDFDNLSFGDRLVKARCLDFKSLELACDNYY